MVKRSKYIYFFIYVNDIKITHYPFQKPFPSLSCLWLLPIVSYQKFGSVEDSGTRVMRKIIREVLSIYRVNVVD